MFIPLYLSFLNLLLDIVLNKHNQPLHYEYDANPHIQILLQVYKSQQLTSLSTLNLLFLEISSKGLAHETH